VASASALLVPEVSQAVPAAGFMQSAIKFARIVASGNGWPTADISPSALALAKAVAQQMAFARLAVISGLFLIVGLVGASSAALVGQASRAPQEERAVAQPMARVAVKAGTESRPEFALNTRRFANAPGYVWAIAPQEMTNTKLTNERDVLGVIERKRWRWAWRRFR
jgi:hypothetical protein